MNVIGARVSSLSYVNSDAFLPLSLLPRYSLSVSKKLTSSETTVRRYVAAESVTAPTAAATGYSSSSGDAWRVEKGKYSYVVETILNQLISMGTRGSVAKCMEIHKGKLSMQDFSLIYREFARRGDWQRANRLFKYMQRHEWCQPTEHIYTIMIGIYGREGMLDKAESLFESMPQNQVDWNVYSFTALINAFGRNGKHEVSLELLDRMKKLSVSPNLITYNTVINACAKGGYDWMGLLDLFAQMRYEGIQPDLITYNTLLTVCTTRCLVQEAGLVFRTLTEQRVVPDVVTYTSLVDTYEKAGQLRNVQQLLKEMETSGNLPDVVGYNILIDAFGRHGYYEEADSVLRQMESAGVPANVETFSLLLEAYGEGGRYAQVRSTVAEMKAKGVALDALTYATLADVLGRGGHFQEAVRLYQDMEEGQLAPDQSTAQGMLYACAMAGLYTHARQLYRRMQSLKIPLTTEMYSHLIRAYGRATLYEEASLLLPVMAHAGIKVDLEPVEALLEAYALGGLCNQSLDLVLSLPGVHDLHPGVTCLSHLIDAHAKAGRYELGIAIHEELVSAGHKLSELSLMALFGCFCGAGLLEEARAQFLEMQAVGLVPNVGAYCQLAALFARRGRWDDVSRILTEMSGPQMPADYVRIYTLLWPEGSEDDVNWVQVEEFLDNSRVEGIVQNTKYVNAIMEALWQFGLQGRALRFLQLVRERGIFPEGVRKSSTIWAVDVHRMSTGAALATILTWLLDVKIAIDTGEELPPLASIVTLWGAVPQWVEELEAVPVRKSVHAFVRQIGAPLRNPTWNYGRLVCSDVELREYLSNSSIEKILLPKTKGQLSGHNKWKKAPVVG